MREQCAQFGFTLLADLGLLPVDIEMIQLSQLRQRVGLDEVDTCPRTCPSGGRHGLYLPPPVVSTGQGGWPFYQLSANARKVTQLLRFRLGCHGLLSDLERHRADPLPRNA